MDKSTLIDPELLLKIINASSDGIVVAEKEGQDNIIIYVNDAFEKLTGYSADDILYRDCRFLQGEERSQEARLELKRAIAEDRPTLVRLKNFRKDGTMFWNELSVTPVFNDDDKCTYYIGIQKDVSKEVDLLEKLKASSNQKTQ